MSSIQNVLIAGAGGNLGPSILKAFLDLGKFNVFVLTRKESKSTFPDTVKIVITDYTPESLKSIFEAQKIDAVVSVLSVLSPGQGDAQIALIDASKASGVKRFIASEFGSDTVNPKVAEHVGIFKTKIDALEYLKTQETDTFSWSAFVPGPFFDWGLKTGFLTVNFKEKKFAKYDEGETLFSTTTLATIGKAVASSLENDAKLSATANRLVYIASHTLNLNQLYAAVEKVTGEKFTVEQRSSEEVTKAARAGLAAGNFFAAFDLIVTATVGREPWGDYSSKLDNELLGLPKADLEADIKAVL